MWNLIPAHSGVTTLINCFSITPFCAAYFILFFFQLPNNFKHKLLDAAAHR